MAAIGFTVRRNEQTVELVGTNAAGIAAVELGGSRAPWARGGQRVIVRISGRG